MANGEASTPGPFDSLAAAAFEHSMDGVLITIPDGRILAANPAACRLLATNEATIRARGRQGFSDSDDPRWQAALEERRRRGRVRAVLPMRRADGSSFLADLSSSLFTEPTGELRTSVIFRDVTEEVRIQQHLRATHEITQALLAGEDTSVVLKMIVADARMLVQATDAAIFRKTDASGSIVVAAADGPRLSTLLGRSYAPGTLAAQILESRQSVLVEDLSAIAVTEDGRSQGFGPGIIVPIMSGEHGFGELLVASPESLRGPFTSVELEVVKSFAEAAGVALALSEARAEVERLAVIAEQHRIGAELHDSVIQQLFAVGLHLLNLKAQVPQGMAETVGRSVQDIDAIIADIRHTVFGLRDVRGETVDEGVQRLAVDAGRLLGFEPRVTVSGSEEIVAPVGSQLLLVLREALSNVVRHSRAAQVDVSVSVEGSDVVLRVVDDGVGIPESPTAGWGLENMAQRATALGGEFAIHAVDPSGTRVEWRVPAGDRLVACAGGPAQSGTA